jgi:uncharacterized protein YndB with AHSA1/START domain
MSSYRPDPKLDLVLERVIDVPRAAVWRAWTEPELLKVWFTPRPWTVSEVEIDLRAGGIFRTVMRSPEGKAFPSSGCILEVVPNERLVWTDALGGSFRPATKSLMTAMIGLEDHGSGTRYTAIAMHADEAAKNRHAEMGFHQGWGAALDQLVALMKNG